MSKPIKYQHFDKNSYEVHVMDLVGGLYHYKTKEWAMRRRDQLAMQWRGHQVVMGKCEGRFAKCFHRQDNQPITS